VPRPSSPLNAKASVRSPYALDRSQQNSCVGTEVVRRPYEGPGHAHTCALICLCQTMMSSQVGPGTPGYGADKPFNSRCLEPTPAWSRAGNSFVSAIAWTLRDDGGARRDRTDDLMLAKHALYQLSYGPLGSVSSDPRPSARGVTQECGGPRQTRTADLTLIRRVL
jgi:hypothetical protein